MLTICLFTRGRDRYLPEALERLDLAIQIPAVQLVIIDNGCENHTSEALKSWSVTRTASVKYFRFDVNQTAQTRVFNKLRELNVDWVNFPGDDDLLEVDFLPKLLEIISDSSVVAVAASMNVVDSNGKSKKIIRKPLAGNPGNPDYLAKSLNEPPFLWPSLFFRISIFSGDLPNSRYVYDWWISLNLIMAGKVITTDAVAINYRVHEGQESSLAPTRRKFFEAETWLNALIESEQFLIYLESKSENEILLFWKTLIQFPPIYSSTVFGRSLLLRVGNVLITRFKSLEFTSKILNDIAGISGVLLRNLEINSLTYGPLEMFQDVGSNFALVVHPKSCQLLITSAHEMRAEVDSTSRYSIACRHAKASRGYIEIACDSLGDNLDMNGDLIISQITNYLETVGDLDFSVTHYEKKLILTLRNLKKFIGAGTLGRLKSLVGGQ
jgi:hypothetical protein